jgi:RNA polymerase sigma-70 factor (ECF subfamily)
VAALEPSLTDDLDLASRIRSGDGDAEEELVRRFQPGLTAIARMRAGRQAASDVVQETFAAALQNLRRGAWQAEGPLAAYLAAILRRLAARRWSEGRELVPAEMGRMVSPEEDPHQSAQKEQTLDRVRQALRQLPSRHREVLLRHYFDEQDVDRIAQELAVPRGTVLSRLHHARRKMARIMNRLQLQGHKSSGGAKVTKEG